MKIINNNKLYRYEDTDGIGIMADKYWWKKGGDIPKEVWDTVTSWLPSPKFKYSGKSYFTKEGNDIFKEKCLPLFTKYIPGISCRIYNGSDIGEFQYIDKYQAITTGQPISYLDEIPDVLFIGSHIQNIKLFDKRYTTNGIITATQKYIYAAVIPKVASAFTFDWNDSMGIKFYSFSPNGQVNDNNEYIGNLNDRKYIIKIPNDYYTLTQVKCSMYTIPAKDFITNPKNSPGLDTEMISTKPVVPIFEKKFLSAEECMKYYGLIIHII